MNKDKFLIQYDIKTKSYNLYKIFDSNIDKSVYAKIYILYKSNSDINISQVDIDDANVEDIFTTLGESSLLHGMYVMYKNKKKVKTLSFKDDIDIQIMTFDDEFKKPYIEINKILHKSSCKFWNLFLFANKYNHKAVTLYFHEKETDSISFNFIEID